MLSNPQSSFDNFYEEFDSAFNLRFPAREVIINKNTHNIEGFMNGGLIMVSRLKKLELG